MAFLATDKFFAKRAVRALVGRSSGVCGGSVRIPWGGGSMAHPNPCGALWRVCLSLLALLALASPIASAAPISHDLSFVAGISAMIPLVVSRGTRDRNEYPTKGTRVVVSGGLLSCVLQHH